MNKPKKKPQRKRKNLIQFYVNNSELKCIQELEYKTSMSRSKIIRLLLMNEKITSMTDVQTLSLLRKLGGLFKHALKILQNRDDISFLRKATDDLIIMIKEINHDCKKN